MSVYTGKNRFLTLDQKIFAGDKQITKIYSDNELIYPAAGGTKKDIYHNVQRLSYIAHGDYKSNVYYGRSLSGYDITESKGRWMLSADVTFLIDVTVEEVPVFGYTYESIGSNLSAYGATYVPLYVSGTLLRVYPEDKKKTDLPCIGFYTGYNDYEEWPQYWNGSWRYGHARDVDRSKLYNYEGAFYRNVSSGNTSFTSTERTYFSKYITAYRQLYNTFTFKTGGIGTLRSAFISIYNSHNWDLLRQLRLTTSRIPVNTVYNDAIVAKGTSDATDQDLEMSRTGSGYSYSRLKSKGTYENVPKGTTWGWPQDYSWEESSDRDFSYEVLKRQKFDFT